MNTSKIKDTLFNGSISQRQDAGIKQIMRAWYSYSDHQDRMDCLAYIMATAYHETGRMMIPVREGFAKSDKEARRIVEKAGYRYAVPNPQTGHVYYGRGIVQLTWADNYQRIGDILGLDLFNHPDLALDEDVSARILVEGCMRGWFTGKSLLEYLPDDFYNARRVINGVDKASLISGYYKAFYEALEG